MTTVDADHGITEEAMKELKELNEKPLSEGAEGEAGEGKGNDRVTEHGFGTSGLRNERKSCGSSRPEQRIYRIVRFLREPELFQRIAAGPADAASGQFGWY